MSMFICELCDKIKDSDHEECSEYQDGLICESCSYELAEMLAAQEEYYDQLIEGRSQWVIL